MHVHASALEFLIWVAYAMIFGFFARVIETKYPDSAMGKALAFIH